MKKGMLLAALLLVLAGCAKLKPCKCIQHPIDTRCVSALPKEANNPAIFAKRDWPDSCWWKIFEDSQLNCLIKIGLANSPSIQAAKGKAEAAYDVAKAERAILLPQLDLVGVNRWIAQSQNGPFLSFANIIPQTYDDSIVGLGLFYDFDLWGKNEKAYKASLDEALRARVEVRQVELTLSATIAATYFQLQSHKEERRLLQELFEEEARIVDLQKQSLHKGLSTEVLLANSEVGMIQVREALHILDQFIAVEEHLLRVLIGEGPVSAREIRPYWHYEEKRLSIPKDLPLNILYRRPDLAAQLWYIEATAYRVGVARLEFLPNINLAALGGFESIHFHNLFSMGSRTGQFDTLIYLPIFNGGRLQANLDRSIAQYEVAVADYNNLVLHAIQEVADQVSIIAIQKKQIAEQIRATALQEKSLSLLTAQKRAGLATQIEVSRAAIASLEQRIIEVGMENEQYLAYIRLLKALGGGFCG